MWKALYPLYNFYRRWFGRYTLDDPRPIQREAPYTFFLPPSAEIDALQPGNIVQLTFRSHPPGLKWDAERMWVNLTALTPDGMTGTLENKPYDMPQIQKGQSIPFQPFHIIATDVGGKGEAPPRRYWDRCFVDDCVFKESVPVYYLYRETPDMAGAEDKYPDSGWRIRGDYRSLTDEELENRDVSYIAIGKVLNADDSWLYLIDSPVGSAFMRNFDTGEYEPYERDDDA